MELKCAVQNYAWGKTGLSSEVAKLLSSSFPDVEIKDDIPYAELWMGTHPSGPSILAKSNQKLSEWLSSHPEALGEKAKATFGLDIPFLFKVLSVGKALSIQAHPNKSHAEKLHQSRPDLYKDPNHKPEMAIALTPFEALCGFRPLAEIQRFMQDIPELQAVIGKDKVAALNAADEASIKDALKACFTALMTCPEAKVKTELQALASRISALEESSRPSVQGELLLRLYSQFPGDVGCFGIYFFNYVLLQPGEAMFLGPNEPHAYLEGDCVECMACSDNVVRAGLTPKYKDVPTLCEMLTYDNGTVEEKEFVGRKEDNFTMLFNPPVPDFAVAKINIPGNNAQYKTIPRNNASIVLVVHGEGKLDQSGSLKREEKRKKARKMEVDENAKSVMASSGTVGSVAVSLHPLVIMNISEHWTRIRAQDSKSQQVVGAIIGKQKGRNIEIMNSFELMYDVIGGDIVIDKDYYNTKEEQFKQVFSDMDFMGWYTTGDTPSESDIKVHKQICEINESPVFMKLNPQAHHTDLPVSIFESVIDLVNGEATMLFVELSYTLATEEAERIGVDHVARMSANEAGESSLVAEHLQVQHSAIKMLHSRIKLILEYVKAIQREELPPNHEVLREAYSLSHRLPVLNTARFKGDFYNQCNDVALMTYLGTITKSCNDMNHFVNKFNVLYDRQGTGRRMRGLFF